MTAGRGAAGPVPKCMRTGAVQGGAQTKVDVHEFRPGQRLCSRCWGAGAPASSWAAGERPRRVGNSASGGGHGDGETLWSPGSPCSSPGCDQKRASCVASRWRHGSQQRGVVLQTHISEVSAGVGGGTVASPVLRSLAPPPLFRAGLADAARGRERGLKGDGDGPRPSGGVAGCRLLTEAATERPPCPGPQGPRARISPRG